PPGPPTVPPVRPPEQHPRQGPVERVEDRLADLGRVVVRPPPDDRVQAADQGRLWGTRAARDDPRNPLPSSAIRYGLDVRPRARRGAGLPSWACSRAGTTVGPGRAAAPGRSRGRGSGHRPPVARLGGAVPRQPPG